MDKSRQTKLYQSPWSGSECTPMFHDKSVPKWNLENIAKQPPAVIAFQRHWGAGGILYLCGNGNLIGQLRGVETFLSAYLPMHEDGANDLALYSFQRSLCFDNGFNMRDTKG